MGVATSTPIVTSGTADGRYDSLFASVDTAQMSVLVLGDGIAEGTGASSITERWPALLQDHLRTVFGQTGGVGFSEALNLSSSITDDPTRSGTITLSTGKGLGYKALTMGAGSTVTWPPRSCTTARVWYSTTTLSGSLAVTVDGGTPVVVPTTSAAASYRDRWLDIPLGASASRTVVVTRNAAGSGGNPDPTLSGVQFFDGDEGQGSYLTFDGVDGSESACPDSAGLDVTGDIDIRVRFRVPDSSLASEQCLIGKWDNLINQRQYMLTVDSNGQLKGYWSVAGSVTLSQAATSMTAVAADTWVWGRWTLDVDNGSSGRTHNFYLSTSDTDDHTAVTWGSAVSTHTTAGTTSIHPGTAFLRVGEFVAGGPVFFKVVGDVRAAAVLNGIDGTAVANPVWTRSSHSVINDAAGNTWTGTGSAATPTLDGEGSGIQVLACAASGHSTDEFDGGSSASVSDIEDWVVDTAAALAIVWLGAEDYLSDDPPATFETRLTTIIGDLRDGDASIPVLLVAGWAPDEAQTYEWSEYVDKITAIADSLTGVDVLDLSAGWPQPGTDEGDASGWYGDTVNLTAAGHAAVAARVVQALVGAPATSTPTVT